MKLLNHTYVDIDSLEKFICNLCPYKTMLIQVFSGTSELVLIQSILDFLKNKLPDSKIIGSSTTGEISNGKILDKSIVLSFCLFDDTNIEIHYFQNCNYLSGVKIAEEIIHDDTKVAIAFAESLKTDTESFLNGFSSLNKDVILCGGNAGDNYKFQQVYIIYENTIYFKGVVLATLNSKTLIASNNYILEWFPIGKEMTVTKAENNILYEIDGVKTIDIYSKYLGESTIKEIPSSAIEYPFIKVEDGVEVARAVVGLGENGSMIYAGHFQVGDKIKFAIGNINNIKNKAINLQNKIKQHPVEATFIYSCSVRKLFMQEHAQYEFEKIEDIAPTCGFFTYGEFFHSKEQQHLLNITTTTLSLSENNFSESNKTIYKDTFEDNNHTLQALIHLVNTTQNELDENMNFLNQYKMLLDENSIVSKTDLNGIITYVNDAFCTTSGYSREELIGKSHNIFKSPNTDETIYKNMWETICNKKIWKGSFGNLNKEGKEYFVQGVIIPILNEKNEIVEFIASRTDITKLLEQKRIIKEQTIDELTGFENRISLLSKLKNLKNKHTLMLINIDNFSDINNFFGYESGDNVLKLFAKKLQNKITNYPIFRISGDEFAVLYENQDFKENSLKEKITSIINRLENSQISINGLDTTISFTCGIAYGSNDILYKLSSIALKNSKNTNKNITFYEEEDFQTTDIKKNIETITKIQDAIANDRIIPYYQGIVDNKTKKIVKYESLIRMIDKDNNVISPYFFLEHSKKAKLYNTLTRILMKKTIENFANNSFEFSINFTLQDILSKETKRILFNLLEEHKCANRLVIEIVESEGIDNFEEVISFIQDIKSIGCKIAIDDFGTGYSNFEYLIKLKADYLKIDGSLIKTLHSDENMYTIVSTIVNFAKSLNMRVIAEFVENKEIFEILKELDVEYSQGYYFSVPDKELIF
ncbi:MAG: EAL domain-containing protein [Aliarcobacter sp.]|nr:EAL domain-containing protein [Aliarcobacter sp.]